MRCVQGHYSNHVSRCGIFQKMRPLTICHCTAEAINASRRCNADTEGCPSSDVEMWHDHSGTVQKAQTGETAGAGGPSQIIRLLQGRTEELTLSIYRGHKTDLSLCTAFQFGYKTGSHVEEILLRRTSVQQCKQQNLSPSPCLLEEQLVCCRVFLPPPFLLHSC